MAWLVLRPRRRGGLSAQVKWRDGSGRTRSRTFRVRDLREAERRRVEVEQELERGREPRPQGHRLTLQHLYERVHAERAYAPATLALHGELWKRIGPALGHRPIGRLTREELEGFLAGIERPAMRDKSRQLLSMLLGYAVEKGLLSVNAVPRRSRPRTRQERLERGLPSAKDRRRYLTEGELARLLAELPERYRALVELMARIGLRPGEAYALKVGKFDPLRRTLSIDESVSGFTKTGEPRTIRLPGVVAEALSLHLAAFSDPSDPGAPMFPSPEGRMLTPGGFRRTFQRAARRAGLGPLTPNDLRHSAASFAIAHGANVYDVQRMLGHSRPSITLDVYGELFEEQHTRFIERLDEAIRRSRAE
ncbi:MAG TPA: site-specific integrase, partial [Actinomycetota bacterium]|nr:site-specific integrase [Actinomycetota bacterium]